MTQQEEKEMDKLIEIIAQTYEVKGKMEALQKENEYLRDLVAKNLQKAPVSSRREQLIAFLEWKHETVLEAGLPFDELVDRYIKSN